MDLTHRLSVPASRDATWNAFADPERLARCFPGAAITSTEPDAFAGTLKAKLGPVAVVYTGTGTYVERNPGRGRLVIETRGRDSRGHGTATAVLTATFVGHGARTDVEVRTTLVIDGRPGQLGPAVISDAADKLFDQFAGCVSDRLAAGPQEAEPPLENLSRAPHPPTVELGAGPGDIRDPDPLVASRVGGTAHRGVVTVVPAVLKRYAPVLGGVALASVVVGLVRRVRR